MVENYILRTGSKCDAVGLLPAHITQTAAQVTHNDIVRGNNEGVVAQTNAITGSSLPRDSDESVFDHDRLRQRDQPGDTEDDYARPFSFTGGAKTTRPGIIEIGNKNDSPAATARSCRAKSFGAWERWNRSSFVLAERARTTD